GEMIEPLGLALARRQIELLQPAYGTDCAITVLGERCKLEGQRFEVRKSPRQFDHSFHGRCGHGGVVCLDDRRNAQELTDRTGRDATADFLQFRDRSLLIRVDRRGSVCYWAIAFHTQDEREKYHRNDEHDNPPSSAFLALR